MAPAGSGHAVGTLAEVVQRLMPVCLLVECEHRPRRYLIASLRRFLRGVDLPPVSVGRSGTAVVIASAALAVLILLVQHHSGTLGLDMHVHRWILQHRRPWITAVAIGCTVVGGSSVVYPLFVAIAALTVRHRTVPRSWVRPLVALAVLAGGTLVRTALSVILHRSRPPRGDWAYVATGSSLPSGHTTTATLAAALMLWLFWPRLHSDLGRAGCAATASIYAAAVGPSRIYLGVHWPTDVLGSYLLALAWLSGTCLTIGLMRPALRK